MARRIACGLMAILAFMVFTLPTFGAPLTVFRLVPMIGWEKLERVNPYVTLDLDAVLETSDPRSDFTNAETSVVQVTARATVLFDTSQAEITVEFIPEYDYIVPVGKRMFTTPVSRQVKGRLVITVRNPHSFPMENVRVEGTICSAFQPSLIGKSQGDVSFENSDSPGLLRRETSIVWNIGTLMPGEAARCEISITTRRDDSGGFGFSQEGFHTLHRGFRLTYSMLGEVQLRRTDPHIIVARENPISPILDTGSSDPVTGRFDREWPYPKRLFPERPAPVPSVPGDTSKDEKKTVEELRSSTSLMPLVSPLSEPAQIERVHESGLYRLTATAVSDNIGVEDGKFAVPSGEEAEWLVELHVECPSDWQNKKGWNGWHVTFLLGEHLTAEVIERLVFVPEYPGIHDGDLKITVTDTEPGVFRMKVSWDWHQSSSDRFIPGSYAYLALKVTTDGLPLNNEDQILCDHINMEYNPVGGSYVHEMPLDPIYIKSADASYADISLTATRIDWRVLKPGTYAVLATEITTSGKGKLSVQFSEFDDLKRDSTPGKIATFYGFGNSLDAVETEGWIPAADLNSETLYIDLSEPSPVLMWSKISLDEQTSSAEYESTGVITFIVSNN
jgi:hypothetical protein